MHPLKTACIGATIVSALALLGSRTSSVDDTSSPASPAIEELTRVADGVPIPPIPRVTRVADGVPIPPIPRVTRVADGVPIPPIPRVTRVADGVPAQPALNLDRARLA